MFHILCVRGEKLMKENTETEISVNSNTGNTEQITCLSFPRLLTRTYQRSISIWVSCPSFFNGINPWKHFLSTSIFSSLLSHSHSSSPTLSLEKHRPAGWNNDLCPVCDDNFSNIVFKVDYPSASAGRSGRYN